MAHAKRRLWDEPDQSAIYDDNHLAREKAWKQHEKFVKRFGSNYQKVLDERRARRRRQAEAARQDLLDRTCSICGVVCSRASAVKAHKALEHRGPNPAPYVGVLLNPLRYEGKQGES